MSDQVWWYATRAAGLMTWSTAVAAVVVGLLLSTRIVKQRTGPWLLDLHRFLGGVSVLFLVAHLVTLYLDSYVDFGARELLIPGESTWNPEATAWGIIAGFTLVLVEVTSLLRKWISTAVWRMFHMMSIVTVAAGSYHAWLGGSDVQNPVTYTIAGSGSAIVVMLVGVRLRTEGNLEASTADRSSREALLMEMRERLEGLPIPDTTTEPELDTTESTSLPRRAPGSSPGASPFDDTPLQPGQVDIPTASGIPAPPPAPPAPTDPFAAVPLSDETPELGDWITPTNDDAFGRSPIDPFGGAPAPAAPSTEPDFAFGQQAADPFLRGDHAPPPLATESAVDPFASSTESPFAGSPFDEPESPFGEPATPASPFGEPAPAFDPTSPLGSGVPGPPAAAAFTPVAEQAPTAPQVTNPFSPADPTPQALSVEVPTVEPAVEAVPGPPPLPESSIDPETGEPDQAAYQAWLIEWLAYAEKYGEETPEDPSRV